VTQRIPLNQNRRVTGTTEILELCKDMLRLEHGIGNVFDMDTAEFTEFRAQFLADFAQIPLIIGIDGRSGTGKTSLAAQLEQELTAAGLDGEIWQCPVVLLADVRSVGVQGDGRTYGHPIVLRPVSSEDAMTADWTRLPYDVLARISNRITNSVPEVNRVVLDCTSKPPGTIEWE